MAILKLKTDHFGAEDCFRVLFLLLMYLYSCSICAVLVDANSVTIKVVPRNDRL